MGSTIVAAYLAGGGIMHVAHVGDSRCYRFRDGRLEVLTHDHTLINDVMELRPEMPEEKAARLPRNVITRALGMSDKLRVSVRSHRVLPGDRYLLCSDGLSNELDEDQMTDALLLAKSAEEQVRLLINLANEHGAHDNVAALVVHCDLAPGTTSLPKPGRLRPPTRKRASTPPGPLGDEYPEIVIVEEDVFQEDGSHQIHVVPPSAKDPTLVNALHDLVDRGSGRCAKCGVAMNVTALVCPECGMPRRPTHKPPA
jgi:PPM family protein phosphatase